MKAAKSDSPRWMTRLRPNLEGLESRALLSVGGSPDFSFGPNGFQPYQTATAGPRFSAIASATQPDGKTVVVGALVATGAGPISSEFTVIRYDADGTLDPTFGTAGEFTDAALSSSLPVGSTTTPASGQAVAIETDGNILVEGTGSGPTVVVRLSAAGVLDPTFASGGIASLPAGFFARPQLDDKPSKGPFDTSSVLVSVPGSVAVLPDGQVAAGGELDGPSSNAPAVVLLDADGAIATGFGTGGMALIPLLPFQSGFVRPFAGGIFGGLVAQPDGKILVVANAQYTTGIINPNQILATRLTATGALDPSYGSGGQSLVDPNFLPYDTQLSASAVALQPDGKLVIGGGAQFRDGYGGYEVGDAVARVDADGALDPSFGLGGVNILTNELRQNTHGYPGQYSLIASALAIGPDGSIVVGDSTLPAFSRLTPGGITDNTFGTGGTLVLPLIGDLNTNGVAGVSIEPGGKINAALAAATDSGLVQLLGQGSPNDFNEDGTSDPAVYDPSTATLTIRPSGGGDDSTIPFGLAGITADGLANSQPAPGAYDGGGVSEVGVYLTSQRAFAVRPYFGGPDVIFPFNLPGPGDEIPIPGDYDGSGHTEFALYSVIGQNFTYLPANGQGGLQVLNLGDPSDPANALPATADYFGVGLTDIAVYLPASGAFQIRDPFTGTNVTIPFGMPGAGNSIPVPGDYEGDGRDQIAVYMPSTGILAYRPDDGSPDVFLKVGAAILPAPGDYDGSGKLEAAAYAPASAAFIYAPTGGGAVVSQTIGVAGVGSVPFVAESNFDAPLPSPLVVAASVEVPLTPDALNTLAGTSARKKAANP